MRNNSSLRAFIAIELPDFIKQKLKTFLISLQNNVDSTYIKWVNPENIHMTIKFLGETDLSTIQAIAKRITILSPVLFSPELQISRFGAFPNLNKPRILWVGCSKPKELLDLYKKVNLTCGEFNFPVETRNFSPHFTIARLKGSPSAETIEKIRANIIQSKNTVFGTFKAPSLIIFKSVLKPSGPVYTVLNKIDLS